VITEILLWDLPVGMTCEEITAKYRASVPIWRANPDLIHKAFLYDESSRRVGGVYLWKTIDAARSAHGLAFQDRIAANFGAKPESAPGDPLRDRGAPARRKGVNHEGADAARRNAFIRISSCRHHERPSQRASEFSRLHRLPEHETLSHIKPDLARGD
jgi:hypothetical protein